MSKELKTLKGKLVEKINYLNIDTWAESDWIQLDEVLEQIDIVFKEEEN